MTAPPGTGGRRVISLVPSITETIMAWGVTPAGVTRFCEVAGIETFGGTKNPDVEAIIEARPDVVLMDREENRRPDAEALVAAGVEVVATDVRHVSDVGPALQRLAAAVGLPGPGRTAPEGPAPAEAGAGEAGAGEAGAGEAGAGEAGPGETGPGEAGPGETGPAEAGPDSRLRVWVPIWRRPWMTVGAATYGTSVLAAAGLDNVFADSADPYPAHELAAAAGRGAQAVLAPSEPYHFTERHRAELETVAPVVFVDGRDLFWWGTRTPGALRRLTELAGALAGR